MSWLWWNRKGLTADDRHDAVRGGRHCSSCRLQRPRVIKRELAAAPRERHRGTLAGVLHLSSYRPQESRTVYRAECQHLEAELPFISFDNILNHIEDLVCTVVDNTPEAGDKVRKMNPSLQAPTPPFLR